MMGANQPASMMVSKATQAHTFVDYFFLQLTLKANEPAPVPGSDGGVNGQELRIYLRKNCHHKFNPEKIAAKNHG